MYMHVCVHVQVRTCARVCVQVPYYPTWTCHQDRLAYDRHMHVELLVVCVVHAEDFESVATIPEEKGEMVDFDSTLDVQMSASTYSPNSPPPPPPCDT